MIPVKTFKEKTAPTPQKFFECRNEKENTLTHSVMLIQLYTKTWLSYHKKGKLKAIYLMNPK